VFAPSFELHGFPYSNVIGYCSEAHYTRYDWPIINILQFNKIIYLAKWQLKNPQWETFHIFCMGFVHKLHTTLLFVFLSAIFSFWNVVWTKYINELANRSTCIKLLSNSQSRLNTEIHAIQKMSRTRYCSLIRRLTSPHLKSGCTQANSHALSLGHFNYNLFKNRSCSQEAELQRLNVTKEFYNG
jgi:hypothetical protein